MSDVPGRSDFESDDRARAEEDGWGSPVPAQYGSLRSLGPPEGEEAPGAKASPASYEVDPAEDRWGVTSLLRRLHGEGRTAHPSEAPASGAAGSAPTGGVDQEQLAQPVEARDTASGRSGLFAPQPPGDVARPDVAGTKDAGAQPEPTRTGAPDSGFAEPGRPMAELADTPVAPTAFRAGADASPSPAMARRPVEEPGADVSPAAARASAIANPPGSVAGPAVGNPPAPAPGPAVANPAGAAPGATVANPTVAPPGPPLANPSSVAAGSGVATPPVAALGPTVANPPVAPPDPAVAAAPGPAVANPPLAAPGPVARPPVGAEAGIDPAALGPVLTGRDAVLGARSRRRRPGRVRTRATVRHIDIGSVLRVSAVFWLVILVALVLASLLLWLFADASGSLPSIDKSVRTLFSLKAFALHPASVAMYTAAAGIVIAIAGMIGTVVFALIYNLIADVVGGIRVDLESVSVE